MAHFRKRAFTGLAGLAVVATGFACGGDDDDECVGPEAQGKMPEFVIVKGNSLERRVRQYFTDPNNDPEELKYAAAIADESVAVVSKVENLYDFTVDGVEVGSTRITVTATDPCDPNLKAEQQADITVGHPNRAPEVGTPIPDFVGDGAFRVGEVREIMLRLVFRDRDGDIMEFDASSDDPGVATCVVTGDDDPPSLLRVTGVAPGSTSCTVIATDPDGESASDEFAVEVVDDDG